MPKYKVMLRRSGYRYKEVIIDSPNRDAATCRALIDVGDLEFPAETDVKFHAQYIVEVADGDAGGQ